MAEGFLRALAGERFDVYSAGLEPGVLHPLTVKVMNERGIDVSGQRAKSLDEYLGRLSFAFVITVCDNAARRCPIFPGTGERLHWPFEDPAEATGSEARKLTKFRDVRDAMEKRIREWLATSPDAIVTRTPTVTIELPREGGGDG
jgi:arsenate reductase